MNQGSFFSSAGGGPVSCMVGLAVLQAIEQDNLQANAAEVELLCTLLAAAAATYNTMEGFNYCDYLFKGWGIS